MKYLFCILALCFNLFIYAQQNEKKQIAKPGVIGMSPSKGLLLEYRYQPSYNYETSNVAYNTRLNGKIKIPLVVKEKTKVLVGYQHMQEKHGFNEINDNESLFNSLNTTTLKTNRVSLYYTYSWNEKLYSGFKAEAMYTGNYNEFFKVSNAYANYRIVGSIGVEVSDNEEFGFGLYASKDFRRKLVLPFAYYYKTYNDKWGLEFKIPSSFKARYNFNAKQMLIVGPEFENRAYVITTDKETLHYRRQGILTSIQYIFNINGWVWGEAQSGYLYNLKTKIENPTLKTTYKIRPKGGFFFKLAFFIFPDKNPEEAILKKKKH